MTDSELCF